MLRISALWLVSVNEVTWRKSSIFSWIIQIRVFRLYCPVLSPDESTTNLAEINVYKSKLGRYTFDDNLEAYLRLAGVKNKCLYTDGYFHRSLYQIALNLKLRPNINILHDRDTFLISQWRVELQIHLAICVPNPQKSATTTNWITINSNYKGVASKSPYRYQDMVSWVV